MKALLAILTTLFLCLAFGYEEVIEYYKQSFPYPFVVLAVLYLFLWWLYARTRT